MKHNKKYMIILVGKSASGKTEIAKRLRSLYGIVKAVTHTTRPMRKGERNGVDYYFVTKEEFLRLAEQGAFVETTEYNGNYYGCSKKEIAEGKCVVVDPSGLRAFKALGDKRIVSFALLANEETRRKRMESRGDERESILRRIENDEATFSNIEGETDFAIVTDDKDIDELAKSVKEDYEAELRKRGLRH